MTVVSPRLDQRLRAAVSSLDDAGSPAAETWRKVGARATELGVARPGYDTIRLLVRDHRRRRDEVRRLLAPVVGDLLQGRVSAWDVQRVIEASFVARLDRP